MSAQPGIFSGGLSPRWGTQTSFFQRRQPAFWLFVITLILTGIDALSQQVQMVSAVPNAWFTTIVLLTPYAIPVIAVIYLIDTYEREPVSILVAAVLWGGIAATTLSMYTNTPLAELIYKLTGDSGFTQTWSAALTAPFVEEGFKALGVILLVSLARSEMDDLLDGFIWGAMVGIGFLLVEDVFYFVRAFGESGSADSLFQMFLIRILGAGPYSHFLYTGLSGMGIAYYTTRTDQVWVRRLFVGLAFAACGVGAHFIWNSPLLSGVAGDGLVGFYVMVTLKGVPMLAGLIIVVRLARRRERALFASLTQAFIDDGSITLQDQAELGGLRARRRARKAAARAKGPIAGKLEGQLQKEQIQLAMAFSRLGSEDAPEVVQRADHVRALKAQLAAMPVLSGAAAGAAGSPAWGAPPVAGGAPAPGSAPAPVAAWGQQTAVPAPVAPVAPVAVAAPIPVWGPAVAAPAPAAVEPAPAPAAVEPAPAPAAVEPAPAPAAVEPAPAPAPAAPVWSPTYRVPDEGMPAWATPDPSRPPVVMLQPRLELILAERAGDWGRVVAVNGWTGWVDGRRLVPRG